MKGVSKVVCRAWMDEVTQLLTDLSTKRGLAMLSEPGTNLEHSVLTYHSGARWQHLL